MPRTPAHVLRRACGLVVAAAFLTALCSSCTANLDHQFTISTHGGSCGFSVFVDRWTSTSYSTYIAAGPTGNSSGLICNVQGTIAFTDGGVRTVNVTNGTDNRPVYVKSGALITATNMRCEASYYGEATTQSCSFTS